MAVVRTGTKQGTTNVPTGAIMPFAVTILPYDWLACDGQPIDRTVYADLFNTIVPSKGSVTFSSSTEKGTLNSHGLNTDDAVFIAGGTAPGGLSNNTIYYINSPTTNDFKLASTRGGSAIDLTSNGSGCTLYFCPYGLGNGSTTFNVPDLRGKVAVGLDNMGGSDAGNLSVSNALGLTGGEENHTLTTAELPSHNHGITDPTHAHVVWTGADAYNNNAHNAGAGTSLSGLTNVSYSGITLQNTGGGGAHNNMQPYLYMVYAIKT